MIDIELTPGASADLDEIFAFSVAEFGETRADRYMTKIEEVMIRLRTFPNSGRLYPGIEPPLRYTTAGSHHIFHRRRGDRLVIERVIHQARLSDDHLSG